MSKTSWIIFSVIAIAILGGLVFFSGNSKVDVSKLDPAAIQIASSSNGNIADHVFGPANSKVVLIEYGDFQCPYCGDEHPIIKQVTEKYVGQVAFVFRNFPLTTLHPNARAAAGAVEAAGLQGKYWEMHNKVFENQSAWENLTGTERNNLFIGYASSLGLNTTTFTTDMASDNVGKKIAFDQAIGKKINVDSTPSFYLDGAKLDQAVWGDATKLSAALDAELTKNGIALPTGSPTTTP